MELRAWSLGLGGYLSGLEKKKVYPKSKKILQKVANCSFNFFFTAEVSHFLITIFYKKNIFPEKCLNSAVKKKPKVKKSKKNLKNKIRTSHFKTLGAWNVNGSLM